MDNIFVPVSPGEVLDKITILEIKSERIQEEEKLLNVRRELVLLKEVWAEKVVDDKNVRRLHVQLKEINEALWDIEDAIRDEERLHRFEERFVELARNVYFTNDRRSRVKKELNTYLGSEIVEEKSYKDYK
jgi:transcriptional regulator of nitric oxide reductase